MDHYKILILSSNTGGGHQYAAKAIKMAIGELLLENSAPMEVEVVIETPVENSSALHSFFVGLYNYLLRHHQAWMKYYTGWIEFFQPNNNFIGYLLACSSIIETLTKIQPSVVVSVHPMANHYVARTLKDTGMASKMKFVIVVTDPNEHLWSGWACEDADLTFAANDLARDRLIELKIDLSRIRTMGMPISPKFTRPPKIGRQELLTQLQLDPERLTILLSGGWVGGGAIENIYDALKQVQRPMQVIILCGHNEQLLADMNKAQQSSSLPTVVLGHMESLSSLMGASDLLVTKGGGLTTFEAVARRLPMALDLLTEAMPQEAGTIDMLIDAKLAQPFRKPEDLVAIVNALKPIDDRESQALPWEHNLDQVDAIFEIAQTILDLIPKQTEAKNTASVPILK